MQLAAPAQPAGLLDGEPGEQPVAGAGLLDGDVDDRAPAGPLSRIVTVRSSSSPSTSVSPARCSKREVERARGEHHRAGVDRRSPGPSARRSGGGRRPRRRGRARAAGRCRSRSATTTSRTLPTRSPLGSKTGSPASRETYALVTVVTGAEGYRRRRERPGHAWTTRSSTSSRPRPFAGNPLAVVFDADDLTTEQCQALANEFHLSETVVRLRAHRPGADYRVRIFTPSPSCPSPGTRASAPRTPWSAPAGWPAGALRQECGAGVLDARGRRRRRDRSPAAGRRCGTARTPSGWPRPSGSSAADLDRPARRTWPAAACLRLPRGARRSGRPRRARPGGAGRARRRAGRLGAGLGRRARAPARSGSSPAACTGTRTRPPARRRSAPASGWPPRALAGDGTSAYVVRQGAAVGPARRCSPCRVTAAGGRRRGGHRGRRRRPGRRAAPIRVPPDEHAAAQRRPGRCTGRAAGTSALMARRRPRRLVLRAADRAGRRPRSWRSRSGATPPARPCCCRCCSSASGRTLHGLRPRQLRSSRRRRAVPRRALRRLAAQPVHDDGRRLDRAGHHDPDLDGAGRPVVRRAAAAAGVVGAGARGGRAPR